jgi:hypothetical protein
MPVVYNNTVQKTIKLDTFVSGFVPSPGVEPARFMPLTNSATFKGAALFITQKKPVTRLLTLF